MSHILVFDLDDTLFPEHQFVRSGFRAAGGWLAHEHGVHGFEDAALKLFEAGERGTIFNQALAALGQSAEWVPSLVDVYRHHAPAIALHDDATWALSHFKRRHRLALITDGYHATQCNKVDALAIAPMFDKLVFSDALGRESWKPSPAPYRHCMEAFPQEASFTYVGDNPKKDFVTAKLLGWNTIQIVRDTGEYTNVEVADSHRAHHQIRSLYELKDLLP